jgi:hypothetical protein
LEDVLCIISSLKKLKQLLLKGNEVDNEKIPIISNEFKKKIVTRDEFLNGLDRICKNLTNKEKIVLI